MDGWMKVRTDSRTIFKAGDPGSYILEELEAPDGYVRTFPSAVEVKETNEVQRVLLSDEKTKVEIRKNRRNQKITVRR